MMEYDAEFFKNVGGYGECKGRDKARAEWLIETFKPQSVLDIGSGFGTLVDWLNEFGVHSIGVDISDYALRFSKNCFRGDISNLNMDETFDLVVGFDILEHIDEKRIDETIKGIVKVCEGHAFFNIPLINNPGSTADPTHKTIKTRQFWIEKFSNYFDVLGCDGCPTLIFKDAQFALKKKESESAIGILLSQTQENSKEDPK